MSTQQKFLAAVNVIRNLPKNGTFQPSTDLQLKFYSYFKQATEGPNTKPKPSFWDIPGQAKWNAWNRLGLMTQEEAMNNYIEELKSIVETMSYNANVETFLNSLGPFYDCVGAEDVDLVFGSVIEKVKSRADSPMADYWELRWKDMTEPPPDVDDHSPEESIGDDEGMTTYSRSPSPDSGSATIDDISQQLQTDSEEEEFSDVIEQNFELGDTGTSSSQSITLGNPNHTPQITTVSDAIHLLQIELNRISERVTSLEAAFCALAIQKRRQREGVAEQVRGFLNLPNAAWLVILIWPVASNIVLNYLRGRH